MVSKAFLNFDTIKSKLAFAWGQDGRYDKRAEGTFENDILIVVFVMIDGNIHFNYVNYTFI